MNEFDKKRIEYNKKVINLLKNLNLGHIPEFKNMIIVIRRLIEQYPHMRFGQIVCNFICPNYTDESEEQNEHEKMFMNYVFGDCEIDPFYEEPWDTLKRLSETSKSKIMTISTKTSTANGIKLNDGFSIKIGSDRYACQVTDIISDKKIKVRQNKVKCLDYFAADYDVLDGQFENGPGYTFTLRKNGRWVLKGSSMKNGIFLHPSHSHFIDPSF